ncbi:MAG: glutamate formimidoyltransferase [Bacteroidales bacterium]|jgi:glutamate formiminotransferase/formiminotetrahydrofolate cyclodeaminase|nr:glutamate formimidoyltransferase [Bacteroidales bacterium]
MERIIECVPNFSEGRDMGVIGEITAAVKAVDGVSLLDVDPGRDANRTVVTFAGSPEEVVEAAFRAAAKAAELIDMSKHHGEHPRMGAMDVCPLVPIAGVTMEECVGYARELAERIGTELGIPVYCYEHAAFDDRRRSLASCRSGEYEGLERKLRDPQWKPDFGPALFNPRSGATVVGARDFLVAFNVNLNTTSVRRANAIAFDVREKGRPTREGGTLTGRIVRDAGGEPVMIPGSLKHVRAIGWYMEEYGIAQVSMNLTDISVTPVHQAFEEVSRKAAVRGLRVTGSELVGLIPLSAMLDAGRYFLDQQHRSAGVPDEELIHIAARSMGLSDVKPFIPEEKIIEYAIGKKKKGFLTGKSLKDYMEVTASEAPVPGGGSASAYIGSLGAALGTMVANLSAHKRGWDSRWKEFSEWACRGKEIQNTLLGYVDEDTASYNGLLAAYAMARSTAEEKEARKEAIEKATKEATMVPFRVLECAFSAFPLIREMVLNGNPNSVSDAAVGAIALGACIRGAAMNVRINAVSLADRTFAEDLVSRSGVILDKAKAEEAAIMEIVEHVFSEKEKKG